jgi:hypothetical protein
MTNQPAAKTSPFSPMEQKVLIAALEEGIDCNGCETVEAMLADNMTWTTADSLATRTGLKIKSVKGVIASLSKKGMVAADQEAPNGEGAPQQVLTDAGIRAAFELMAEAAEAEASAAEGRATAMKPKHVQTNEARAAAKAEAASARAAAAEARARAKLEARQARLEAEAAQKAEKEQAAAARAAEKAEQQRLAAEEKARHEAALAEAEARHAAAVEAVVAAKAAEAEARAALTEARAAARGATGRAATDAPTNSQFAGKKLFPATADNPRAAGTGGHRSFAIIADQPGLTYEAFRVAGGRRQDLAWDVARGWVEVRD